MKLKVLLTKRDCEAIRWRNTKLAEDNKKKSNQTELKSEQTDKFEGTYWQWIMNELHGWDRFPWFLFGLGAGFQLAVLLLKPITWISVVSFIACFFGLWCTVAMGAGGVNEAGERVSSHAINGLFGTISVVGYIIVNVQAGHWWSILDQLIFFFLIDLELMLTWRTWGRGKQNVIKKLSNKNKLLSVVAILVLWGILYEVGLFLHDTSPVFDSLELAIGATASFLCFRRYTETYSYWLLSDIINVALWTHTLQQGISPASLSMLAMTVFYLATAIMGKLNWKPTKTDTKSEQKVIQQK